MIVHTSYSFISVIEDNVLVTANGNFNVVGNPTLNTDLSITLNGLNQYIDLGDQSSNCLGNYSLCKLGLTVSFDLTIKQLFEGMYFITNGGDLPGSAGIAMYYERERIFVTVSTLISEWTVETTQVEINVMHRYEFSWSEQMGLSLYIDEILVAHTNIYISRIIVTVTRVMQFVIGRSLTAEIYTNCDFGGFEVAEATRDTTRLVALPEGKICLDYEY